MTPEESKTIRLAQGNTEVIVAPHIGGRIVSLRYNGKQNIFKADSAQWDDPQTPELDAYSEFKAYNGHTVWVGPQSDWWVKQNLNPQRKANAVPWPPDPFLTYSDYSVEFRDAYKLQMLGADSPVSGVRLLKEIAVNADNSVYFKTIAQNIRTEQLYWDLWFNTRMDGYCRAYVPVATEDDVKVSPVLSSTSTEMPYTIVDGFFTYLPTAPNKPFIERSSKAFIYPSKPYIAGFTDSQVLIIRFEHHHAAVIHPQQALVEIYNHTEDSKSGALLELEYHSPYLPIAPGRTMEAWEVWEVHDYNGPATTEGHVAFLQDLEKQDIFR